MEKETNSKHSACHYLIKRDEEGKVSVEFNGEPIKHVIRYAMDKSLNYGYPGKAPADLALSILTDFFIRNKICPETTAPDVAVKYHHNFKWEFLAHEKRTQFLIGDDQIIVWMDNFNESSRMINEFLTQ